MHHQQESAEEQKEKVFYRTSGRWQTVSGKAESAEALNAGERVRLDTEQEKGKIKNKPNGIATVLEEDRKKDDVWNLAYESPRLGNLPKQSEGEQVAAGWPAWLAAVAGEALRGWLPRRADLFEKIDKIGQGTYSNVYKARDLESGKVVALKKVRFDNLEPESVSFMAREIKILRRLDHPNIVKLEGLVTSRMSCSLYLVFEYMDHDLAGIAACPNITFTEAQVKCYLLQILKGLDHCHNRGVLHRDIKGSNLLLDSGGNLKIADFGLATFFQPDKRQQFTTRVVTLWYRPPELLLGATEYGTAIDIWSVGCILGELFAGRPILPGRTEVEQLHKIFKLCGSPPEEYWKKYKLSHATIFKPQHPYKRMLAETYKHFPQTALELLDVLLAVDPDARGSASGALQSDFFNTKPFACEPSSLPKYLPSKNAAKGREDKGRRQRDAGTKTRESDASKKNGIQENPSKAAAAQEAKVELASNNERFLLNAQSAPRSRSERFNVQVKDLAPKLPADAPRQHNEGGRNRVYALPPDPAQPDAAQVNMNWAGIRDKKSRDEGSDVVNTRPPLSRSVRRATTVPDFKSQGVYGSQQQTGLSKLSTLVATRNNGSQEFRNESFESKSKERVRERKKTSNIETAELVDVLKPIHLAKGLDDIDMQDDVHPERTKKPGFGGPAARMHFSGPLLPPSSNVDHVMHEHERQIQKAVRRARHEKDRNQHNAFLTETQGNGGRGADESMKGFGFRESYGPTLTSNSRSKFRSHFQGEIIETKKAEDDLDAVFETYDNEREMRYL